jgi:predicted amidohydrolase
MVFNSLNVCLIESDISSDDKVININNLKEHIDKLPYQNDLVVVPELFTTGFINSAEKALAVAEKNTGNTISELSNISQKYSCGICGSFLANTVGKLFNRAFFIEPNDETFYDKRHLFTMGGEPNVISQGYKESPITRFRGFNIKLIVCYDLRFPVFCRNVKNNYDVLLVVANWPKARFNAWKSLLVARAIENCCYVCAVNRCGTDSEGIDYGCGSSMIIDYKGQIISQTAETLNVASASLSLEKLNAFRSKFPVWNDADEFKLEL